MGSRPVRRLDQPRTLGVVTGPTGLPHAVLLDGKRRHVMAIRDEWLVQDRWWTDAPIDRRYFELVIEPGRVIVIFHDARIDEWRTHAASRTASRPAPAGPARPSGTLHESPVTLFGKRPLPK